MSKRLHYFSATVTRRDSAGIAVEWEGACARHSVFIGSTYEDVEDAWREHVYDETGRAPAACGSKVGRWQPEAAS